MNPFTKPQNHLLTKFFGQNKVYTITYKIKNMALYPSLTDDEFLELEGNSKMKAYRLKIITPQGTITETIKAIELNVSTSGRYYYFRTEDGKMAYYPVNNTIVTEI